MPGRIAVGGIEHESTSFIPTPTRLSDFERTMRRGDELRQLGDSNTIVDGFVKGLRERGLEMAPLSWTHAPSGGLASTDTFETLLSELLERLRDAGPVDGVLLSLHGSFAVENDLDADGTVLQEVRKVVGNDCRLLAVHDFHCNITPKMVGHADALIVERTYPHIDMAERAQHAVSILHQMLRGKVRPKMAFRSLPLLWSPPRMITAEPPISRAIEQLGDLDATPGVLSASLGVGYQWIDSPHVGAAAIVVTDGDAALAERCADNLGRWVWERRDQWLSEPVRPADALQAGLEEGRFPIVLADQCDNTGGGAPGDGVQILRLFLERQLQDAAVLYIVDPLTAAAAHSAGQGAVIDVEIGGRSHPLQGPPLPLQVQVMAISDGRFTYDGPMWEGVEDDLGPSAWLQHEGVHVVVTSRPQQPIDLAFTRSLGLDCRQLRVISVKSTGHFRSGFEPIAGTIYNVDAGGLLGQDFAQLPYTQLGRKMYPLDSDAAPDWL